MLLPKYNFQAQIVRVSAGFWVHPPPTQTPSRPPRNGAVYREYRRREWKNRFPRAFLSKNTRTMLLTPKVVDCFRIIPPAIYSEKLPSPQKLISAKTASTGGAGEWHLCLGQQKAHKTLWNTLRTSTAINTRDHERLVLACVVPPREIHSVSRAPKD